MDYVLELLAVGEIRDAADRIAGNLDRRGTDQRAGIHAVRFEQCGAEVDHSIVAVNESGTTVGVHVIKIDLFSPIFIETDQAA